MRILIVEDEFISRNILLELLQPYGKCDIAVNGKEAVEAFHKALDEAEPYRLVCLDIMMPEYDGHYVLANIRKIEAEKKIPRKLETKVVMTTALGDYSNVMKSFNEQCEAYLVKPIKEVKLLETLKKLDLI